MFLHIWFPLIFCSVKIIVFPEVGPSSIYLKILPPRVACTWLFVLWCNLKWFHQVSQQQCEMGKKICTHWTDGEAMWLWLEPWFTAQYGDMSLRPHCQTATISGALLRQYCFKQRDFKHSVNNFLSSPPLPPPPPQIILSICSWFNSVERPKMMNLPMGLQVQHGEKFLKGFLWCLTHQG